MKKIVKSNLTRVIGYPAPDALTDASIPILPGVNEVAEDLYDHLKKNSSFMTNVKGGHFVLVSETAEVENEDADNTLEAMRATDAVALIEETENTELLREWKKTAHRSTVVKALDKKLKEIEDERKRQAKEEEAKRSGNSEGDQS